MADSREIKRLRRALSDIAKVCRHHNACLEAAMSKARSDHGAIRAFKDYDWNCVAVDIIYFEDIATRALGRARKEKRRGK